jgi:hypothetical protein
VTTTAKSVARVNHFTCGAWRRTFDLKASIKAEWHATPPT